MNPLRELSLLESRDVISERFEAVHGRVPNATKCRQIAAHLLQGRQYWHSALDAGDLIRPLLLYYGSLSLCRGLTLFALRGGGEETLSNSHGMHASAWGQTFASRGVAGILDFRVRITSGTLTQLNDATGGQELTRSYVGPFPSCVELVRPCRFEPADGTDVTIRDLIKRVPELAATYERVACERAAAYPSIPFTARGAHIDLDILLTDKGPQTWNTLREDLRVPDDIEISEGRPSHFGGGQPAATIRTPWTRADWIVPQLAIDATGGSWTIGAVREGQNWNQLTILFMLAFAMGMLVRYHPSVWLDMSSYVRGDMVFPLLKEARVAIEERLPGLVVNQFDLLLKPQSHKL